MIPWVRVNNTRYSWNSSRFLVQGVPTKGFVAFDFEETRERTIVYADRNDGTPVGWTSGKYAVKNMKIKLLKEAAVPFKQSLALLGAGSFGDAEFALGAQLVEPAIGSIPITLVGFPCAITGRRWSTEEGIDATLEEFDLACLQVIEGGLPLWSLVRALQL